MLVCLVVLMSSGLYSFLQFVNQLIQTPLKDWAAKRLYYDNVPLCDSTFVLLKFWPLCQVYGKTTFFPRENDNDRYKQT